MHNFYNYNHLQSIRNWYNPNHIQSGTTQELQKPGGVDGTQTTSIWDSFYHFCHLST